ncbi:hypothetical protein [Okeania sp. SIO3B5]|uniref:hypothetical protein n=1 Tax=Okeania sp. SIO3B5 TaxID=2607811 RepID=UPI0025FDCB08|nr:hypothetical protein [Okeania sp. SIO3B5]
MSVTVEFPEELLIACREEEDVFQRRVMVLTLGKLYEEGKISSGVGVDNSIPRSARQAYYNSIFYEECGLQPLLLIITVNSLCNMYFYL